MSFYEFQPSCYNLSGVHLQCTSHCNNLFLSTIDYLLVLSAYNTTRKMVTDTAPALFIYPPNTNNP